MKFVSGHGFWSSLLFAFLRSANQKNNQAGPSSRRMYGNRGRLETVQKEVSKKASVRCSSICLYEILTDGGALQSRHENLKNLLYGLEPYLNNAGRKRLCCACTCCSIWNLRAKWKILSTISARFAFHIKSECLEFFIRSYCGRICTASLAMLR